MENVTKDSPAIFNKDSNDSNDITQHSNPRFVVIYNKEKLPSPYSRDNRGRGVKGDKLQTRPDKLLQGRGDIYNIVLSLRTGWARMSVLNLTLYRLVWMRNMPLCFYLGNELYCSVFSQEWSNSLQSAFIFSIHFPTVS